MPPRDEQDYERRRQQIIDGAMHVFSTKGFESATNKDIARAAKIGSPGLIYHYFKDKADLFKQVVYERAPLLQLLEHGDEMLDLPPREVLTHFGVQFLEMTSNRASAGMFKLMVGEVARRPAVADMLNRIGPLRGFSYITRYLQHQMDAGILRPMDASAAARCFIGPFIAYIFAREIFVQPDSQSLDARTMVATAVDIFLQGMEINRET